MVYTTFQSDIWMRVKFLYIVGWFSLQTLPYAPIVKIFVGGALNLEMERTVFGILFTSLKKMNKVFKSDPCTTEHFLYK